MSIISDDQTSRKRGIFFLHAFLGILAPMIFAASSLTPPTTRPPPSRFPIREFAIVLLFLGGIATPVLTMFVSDVVLTSATERR